MPSHLRLLVLISASFICFLGYCAALIDWVQDYQTGLYSRAIGEAILETGAILFYTYAGIRFAKSRVPFL